MKLVKDLEEHKGEVNAKDETLGEIWIADRNNDGYNAIDLIQKASFKFTVVMAITLAPTLTPIVYTTSSYYSNSSGFLLPP